MELKSCECEHISHIERDRLTPNGNPGHKYGQSFYAIEPVKTICGTFHLCKDCREDCFPPDSEFRIRIEDKS